MTQLRVLIADDHPVVRKGLLSMLSADPGLEVVACATNGREAVDLALAHEPDVVLMDLQMPEMGGIEATREIVAARPDAGVLVITLLDDDDSVFLAVRAGARGYVLKNADDAEVLQAIHSVVAGAVIFSPGIAQRILAVFSAPRLEAAAAPFPDLTGRERQILELIAQGYPNPRIAAVLDLSPKTVGNYVSSIFSKLQVADRSEAIVRARDAGFGRSRERA